MNRKILIQGFLKMFVPLLIGTITAIAAGCLVGMLFGVESSMASKFTARNKGNSRQTGYAIHLAKIG